MQRALSIMANNSTFLVNSNSLPRHQDGDENAAALVTKAQHLHESTNNHGMDLPPVENDSSDEEDVHQCGRCKDIFRSLQSYMQHKASKVCRVPKAPVGARTPEHVPQPAPVQEEPVKSQETQTTIKPSNILEEAAKDTIYHQLEILVVDEEQEPEAHSTVDVQSISNVQTAPYLHMQQKDVGEKLNAPLMPGVDNKKGTTLGMNESQPEEVFDAKSEPGTGRKKTKSRQIFQTNIQPLTGDVVNSDMPLSSGTENTEEDGVKRKKPKMKKAQSTFQCSICKLEFTSKQLMLEHKSKHTKLFKCKTCSESFYTEEKLNRHSEKESHHYPCEICGKVLVSKASLQRHKVVHGEKNHICDVCNRAFKTLRDMKNHRIGVHSEEKNFICEHCGKAFARREKLKRHSLIHSPNRPCLTCPFKNHTGCDKVFYRKDKLTRHLYSHSKIKPFKCEHCMKTFARTDNLREHMRTHTGVFRYYCTICGKGQPGPKKYQQHMLKQHNIENFQVPMPIEDSAPEELIEQHKAVVMAESTTRASRGAKARKKSHSELDLARQHSVEQEFAALHHTSMVASSYSTVSLRDIDPIATMHTGEHHLLHPVAAAAAVAAHENPGTPSAIHPRPPQGDESAIRVNEHEQPKQEYTVQDMSRNVLDMTRVVASDLQRSAVQELSRAAVSDMARRNMQDISRTTVHELARVAGNEMQHVSELGRSSVSEMTRNDEMGRGTPQLSRPDINRPVQELSRPVQELRMKVPEIRAAVPDIVRSTGDISRNVQEISRRGHAEMTRGSEMVTNILVPASHAERPIMVSAGHPDRSSVMPVTANADRANIMVQTSHAERGNIMVPSSHAGERVGIHLLSQSVIQPNMPFTNLLNMGSDLASIGEAVVRNQGLPVMSSIFKTFHGQSMQ